MTLKLFTFSLLTLTFAACSPYTNIPPENGDWASNNPNTSAVRSVSIAAVQKSLEAEPINGPYTIVLPERTEPATYALVANALGSDALIPTNVPVVELDEKGRPIKTDEEPSPVDSPISLGDFPEVEVRSIYIRGVDADVDIVRPSLSGRSLSTVDLVWEPGFGWSATDIRAWRVDPDALPKPGVPPAQRPLESQAATP
ncbi:MAG: hypothetical protein AAGH99_08935 [Planctomycetota bacterium]